MNRLSVIALLNLGALWFAQSALAQPPTVEQQLAEFRSRIESLERENAALRQTQPAANQGGPELSSSLPDDANRPSSPLFLPPAKLPPIDSEPLPACEECEPSAECE